jgi:ketosteroid isomerase-like protein
MRRLTAGLSPLVALLVACTQQPAPAPTPTEQFWTSLSTLCGQAYAGTITEAIAGDTAFADKALVMHVRSCSDSVILVPFHVGEDRSRTWVLTRLADGGLRLKHDHRHADGLEDSVAQYGGDAPADRITATSVEFPADAFTAQLIPAAATNVWTVMVEPGVRYVYALRREGTDRRFRGDFDLSTPVPAPPAPWGHE